MTTLISKRPFLKLKAQRTQWPSLLWATELLSYKSRPATFLLWIANKRLLSFFTFDCLNKNTHLFLKFSPFQQHQYSINIKKSRTNKQIHILGEPIFCFKYNNVYLSLIGKTIWWCYCLDGLFHNCFEMQNIPKMSCSGFKFLLRLNGD